MPRKTQPWFRFYVEAVHDRKIRRLKPEHRWVWVALLAAAKRSPLDGYLLIGDHQALDEHDLADIAAVTARSAKTAMDQFADAGMITFDGHVGAWHVTKWNERQFASDNSTPRTRKHRSTDDEETTLERSNDVPGTAVGTEPLCTDTETDTDTENSRDARPPKPDPLARFDEFWEEYPRHVAKGAARKAWPRAVERAGNAQTIIDGATRYAENVDEHGTEPSFVAYPATWLNADRWDDELAPPPNPNGKVTPPKQVVT